MAEGDEKKDAGGGEDEKNGEFPTGFRFVPTDVELIEYYLLPKLQGRPSVPNNAIIEANVYECHPDTLIYEKYKSRGEDAWYFLSPRARMYQNGVRPSRKTEDGRGRWKASTATKVVEEQTVADGINFCKNVLNYFEGTPKDEERTKWLMRELTIPEYEIKLDQNGPNNMLDEYVMCKIYVSPGHKREDDDEAGTSSAREGAQHSQRTAASELSEKQAGKRPVVEQTRRCGVGRKRGRQRSLSIGSSTQASGAGNVSVPAAYYGVPGQPMATMSRPSGMHNGQAPVQRPPGAYNGQALVQRPPIPMQFPTNSVATNPNYFGGTTTMMPPLNLAGQAVRPPCFLGNPPHQEPGTRYRPQVSLNCCYDQNYRAVQPPGTASYGMQLQRPTVFRPPRQRQQLYFGGAANHQVRATVPRCLPHNSYPYQYSLMTPAAAAGGHGGVASPAAPVSEAANQASGTGNCNINAEHLFVELAAINTSLAGARPQTAPAHRFESAAPIGEVKLEAKMEETSSLHKQDTV